MKKRKTKSNSRQHIKIVLFWLMAAFLIFNSGAISIFKHFLAQRRLNNSIEDLERENELLRNEIYNLEKNPDYFIRAVKREYGLIEDGEIEYQFKVK
jgi:cell division protein FtsB